MPELIKASTPYEMLSIFDRERDSYGWATAKETINRLAKHRNASAAVAADPRFLALLEVPATAIVQGVMDSKARLNYQTDDLTSIQASLKKLRVPSEHKLHELLAQKLEEERLEEDEPGEFGSDFQGGSVGF